MGAGRKVQGSVSELDHYHCCSAQPVPHFEQFLMPKRDHLVLVSGSLWGRVLVQTAAFPLGSFGLI